MQHNSPQLTFGFNWPESATVSSQQPHGTVRTMVLTGFNWGHETVLKRVQIRQFSYGFRPGRYIVHFAHNPEEKGRTYQCFPHLTSDGRSIIIRSIPVRSTSTRGGGACVDGQQHGCDAFNSGCLGQWSLGRLKPHSAGTLELSVQPFRSIAASKNHAELVSGFGPSFVCPGYHLGPCSLAVLSPGFSRSATN